MISQKWIDAYRQWKNLIEIYSTKFGIPVEIICGVISQESGWNTGSMRYEPAFQKRYVDRDFPKQDEAWRHDMATSFGLMQIMGLVAKELGFMGKPRDLFDPIVGIEWGCRKLASLNKRYPQTPKDAIAAYNQGNNRWFDKDGDKVHDPDEPYNNQYYVDKVLDYATAWSEVIKKEAA